jgi:hypothetical protein
MTDRLDPYELTAPDEWELPEDGVACSIEDTDCEACQ